MNSLCVSFHKPIFISDAKRHGDTCGDCREPRCIREEKATVNDTPNGQYRKVTVHFGLNLVTGEYRSTAVIEDKEMEFGGEVEIWTPLIPTMAEGRALKMAENIFTGMNLNHSVFNQPVDLDFNSPEFSTKLQEICQMWDAIAEKLHGKEY